MPVEFIGMISTRDQSEIRPSRGPVVDRDYVRRFARAHEDAGFDRVLIGYASSQPDGLQVAAYAGAAHTEGLSFLVAHRPGFVAPTLAARTFATLDQFAGGRIAVHIITGGSDAEQRRDGDYLAKDERYDRTGEYLDILKQAWTSDAPFDYHGRYYQLEDYYAEVRSAQQPRIPVYFGGSSDAAYRVGGQHADVYALWGEPLAETREQIASVQAAAAAAGRAEPPRISVSFRPILGPTEELAWERAHRILDPWPPPRPTGRRSRASGGAGRVLGGAEPQNRGSQRLLAAAAKGELHDRALWTPLASATGAAGNSTALVGTPETVARALLDYVDIGVTTILIRGYDPYDDAIDYGRHLLPLVREEVARRERAVPAAEATEAARRPRRPRRPSSPRPSSPRPGRNSMSSRQIKLGAVTMGAGGPGAHFQWLDPEIPGDASVNIDWYIEVARQAEAARFDLIFIVDSQFITADSPPHYLNRLEPMTLLSALAVSTRHLGLVATMTTSYNDPFNLARRLASLDLISGGRSGWNVVTSGDAGAAANFSREEHYDYDTRYGRGLEFVRVCQGLWDSYEADAFPRDRAARSFLDPAGSTRCTTRASTSRWPGR